jgi:hypothetical protein
VVFFPILFPNIYPAGNDIVVAGAGVPLSSRPIDPMKTISYFARGAVALVLSMAGLARLSADAVETKEGARITGKIVKIEAGAVVIDTSYAGKITVKQSEVTSITTDAPVAVRLVSGTRIDGSVATQEGAVKITGGDGTITTTVDKVAATWAAGAEDPAVIALRRKWSYEAGVDIEGVSGNRSSLQTAGNFKATLTGPVDTLQFYAAYDRVVSSGDVSADQFKAGVDYANNFSGTSSWYVRDEGGFDRVMNEQFYDIAAFGYGNDFIKETDQTLTGRVGLSYREVTYEVPSIPNVNSAGLDVELNYSLKLKDSQFTNKIAWVPAFSNFSVYYLTQDAEYQIPLTNPRWKLGLGVANNYNSEPGAGIKKLDTTYYTRLVLDWQ